MGMAAQGAVVSQQWSNGKLTLQLNDGSAELEWISSVAFRFTRSWGERVDTRPAIAHERVAPEMSESNGVFTLRSRYLRVELDRADLNLHVKNGETPVASAVLEKTSEGVKLRLGLGPNEKVFGLMGGASGRLNLRGERLERERGFMFTSAGYGIFVRAPERCVFDLASGTIEAPGASSIDYVFYYGPTPKEIFEQHQIATGPTEVKEELLELPPRAPRLPPEATPLPKAPIDTWDALGALVRRLNQWSLSAVLYPALDVMSFYSSDISQRVADLTTLLPIVYQSQHTDNIMINQAIRGTWKPYLITYLREAHDRGYPLIRPLAMEFSRDANADQQADVFMLGDELLIAPVLGPGGRRRLELPMGIWTDLRTNTEYRGRQTVEVDAPPGRVPMFIRNGSLVPLAVPLASPARMELHYFPSLAAEFFLWEPGNQENSQFHAAPAGDLIRVEVETQVLRTYEWVIHHTKAAREVAEAASVYQRVVDRAMLKPGTWWHDAERNDLHLMLRAETGSDRIVNISF